MSDEPYQTSFKKNGTLDKKEAEFKVGDLVKITTKAGVKISYTKVTWKVVGIRRDWGKPLYVLDIVGGWTSTLLEGEYLELVEDDT